MHRITSRTTAAWAQYNTENRVNETLAGDAEYAELSTRQLDRLLVQLAPYAESSQSVPVFVCVKYLLNDLAVARPTPTVYLPRTVLAGLLHSRWLYINDARVPDWHSKANMDSIVVENWIPHGGRGTQAHKCVTISNDSRLAGVPQTSDDLDAPLRTIEEQVEYSVGIAVEESRAGFAVELARQKTRIDTQATTLRCLDNRLTVMQGRSTVAVWGAVWATFLLCAIAFVLVYYYFT